MSDTIELPDGTIGAVAEAIREEAAAIGYEFGAVVTSPAEVAAAVAEGASGEAYWAIARAAIKETIRVLMAKGYLCRKPKGGV